MGAVYLTYSAYYVSINIAGMKIFIGVSYFLYLCLLTSKIVYIKSSLSCIVHCCNKKLFRNKVTIKIIIINIA